MPHRPTPRRAAHLGAAVVEYALLAALVGGVAIGSVVTLGNGVQDTFSSNEAILASQQALAQDRANGGALPDSGGGGGQGGGGLPPTPDTTPDAFAFPPSIGWPGQPVPSATIAIAGIDSPAAFSVTGDASAVAFLNGGTTPLAFGTLVDGDTLTLEAQAPLAEGASLPVSLTVGGVEAVWILSSHDITPDSFAFAPSSTTAGAPIGSDPITIAGITTPVPFSFAGDLAVIAFRNGDPTPLASGTVDNGDTLVLEATAPAAEGTTQQAVLSVGNTDAAWDVSAFDTTPDAFVFAPQTGLQPGATATSDAITLAGTNGPAAVSVSGQGGPEVSIDGGAFTSGPTTTPPGSTVVVRFTAPATTSATHTATVTIGGVTGTFQATTVAAIVATASNAPSTNLATAFGPDWAADVAKTFVVPAGAVLGPVTIPAGMGGTLTVQNAGEIQGLGGAGNGGAGGDAITSSVPFTLINTGAVRGGGGGGAQGGQGGAGSTIGATEGPSYNQAAPETSVFCDRLQGGGCSWAWAGTQVGTSTEAFSTLVAGGRTYTRGAIRRIFTVPGNSSEIRWVFYEISRSGASTPTAGGTGGAGGAGQGYGQTATAGTAGAAGGTNAGAGGAGGAGGGWGTAGATGATGAPGTVATGTTGSPGGPAGRAVRMLSGTLTVSTAGTINGAY